MDDKYLFTGILLDWVDGDTITAEVDLGFKIKTKIRVRLARINSWELRDASGYRRRFARHARAVARKLFPETSGVTIRTLSRDRYGRWVSEVYAKGLNISDRLLESGEKGFEKAD